MTKEKYLTVCEQMGQVPSLEKCPPDFSDFPLSVQQAIEIFNKLGDRVYPDIGYTGKDYTALDLHMEVAHVYNKEIVLETLLRLDEIMIKKSAEQVKKARKEIENKSKK